MCGCGLLPWLLFLGRSLKEEALGSRTGIRMGSTLTFVREVCRFANGDEDSLLSGLPSNASFRSDGVAANALTGGGSCGGSVCLGGNSCGGSVCLGRGVICIVDS